MKGYTYKILDFGPNKLVLTSDPSNIKLRYEARRYYLPYEKYQYDSDIKLFLNEVFNNAEDSMNRCKILNEEQLKAWKLAT